MNITRITASASRKVPHPTLEYASLSTLVSFEAQLQDGDDPVECLKRLQGKADAFVESHTQSLYRHNSSPSWRKPQQATEAKAAKLAEKHGEKF